MKYLSARQMWHDSHYNRSGNDLLLEINKSAANLLRRNPVMNETQTRGPASNTGRICHMVEAGKVQSAIAKLPAHLQAFGHYCWSPKEHDRQAHYKNHLQICQILKSVLEQKFQDQWGMHGTQGMIIINNLVDNAFERDLYGSKAINNAELANRCAVPKSIFVERWSGAVSALRKQLQLLCLDADTNPNLELAAKCLAHKFRNQGKEVKGERTETLARLAIKEFAHRDQALLFSAGESRELVLSRKKYPQSYLSWRLNCHESAFQKNYGHDWSYMLIMCEDMARDALMPVAMLKDCAAA